MGLLCGVCEEWRQNVGGQIRCPRHPMGAVRPQTRLRRPCHPAIERALLLCHLRYPHRLHRLHRLRAHQGIRWRKRSNLP